MSRYKAYPEYTDSGLQWLGGMPNHWRLRKSKYIFSRVQRGVRSEDGVVTAFRDGQVTLRTNRRTEGFTESIKEIGYQGVREGDLLVHAMDGFAGAIGVSDSDGKCSPVCSVCIPTDESEVHARYFGYLVRQLAVTDYISSLAKGIRERSTEFRYSEFSVLGLALPPKSEQKTIADFLDHETAKIDDLIEKQQRLIELLKEKRQAVISHAVTKGLDPSAPMKDSGGEWLGEVPAHWEVIRLKNVISKIESGVSVNAVDSPAGEGFLGVLKTSCVYRGEFDPAENKAVVPDEYDRVACPVTTGTLIVSRMNTPDLVGAAGVVRQNYSNLYLPDRLWQVTFAGAAPAFVHYWSNTPNYRAQVKVVCAGTSSSMQNLSQDDFRCFFLAVPSVREQNAITAFLECETAKFDRLMSEAQGASILLQERRTALISAAVTGKIDVRDWQAAA